MSDYLKGFISVSDVTSWCDEASLPHRRNKKKRKALSYVAVPHCQTVLFPSYSAFIGPFCLPQGLSPGSFVPLTSGSQRGFSICCASPPAAGSQRENLDSDEHNFLQKYK